MITPPNFSPKNLWIGQNFSFQLKKKLNACASSGLAVFSRTGNNLFRPIYSNIIYLYTRFTETRFIHPLLFGVVPFLGGTHRKLPYIRDHLWQPYLLWKRSSPSRRIARLVKGIPIFKRSAKLKMEWMREEDVRFQMQGTLTACSSELVGGGRETSI